MNNRACPWLVITIFFYGWLLSGCATPLSFRTSPAFSRPATAQGFFQQLDEAVDRAGVRDAADFPVAGFAYLRTSRFLAALKDRLEDDAQRQQWVRWMQRLDLEGRQKEIANLPPPALEKLAARLELPPDRRLLYKRVQFYSNEMLAADLRRPDFFPKLRRVVRVPSEYSDLWQVIGLYPLAALPVAAVTLQVNDEIRGWHRLEADRLKIRGNIEAYGPEHPKLYTPTGVAAFLARARNNPLAVPLPSEAERQKLVRIFAPVFEQDVAADDDRIGKLHWQDDRVTVDVGSPVAYYYFSYGFFRADPILQINYVIWYAARGGDDTPWYERGHLDGLTVRISLDPVGRPFMVDVMNNCGCYQFFVPRREVVQRITPLPQELDAFVPRWMPPAFPERPLGLRIQSGRHLVEHLQAVPAPVVQHFYRLVPYRRVEMLPRPDGGSQSIFDAAGMAKGSGRIEPLIFFSMGVPSVGSMRQRGHHAIKFVGRAHFDDPDLFDRHFRWRPSGSR